MVASPFNPYPQSTNDAAMMDPLETAYNRLYTILGKFDLYGNYGADPLLRSRRELVCQIFEMVDYPEDLEMSVAALRIIQDMSHASQFDSLAGSPHKLFTILEEAGKLQAAQQSFMNRLEREEDERIRVLGIEDSQSVLLHADDGAAYEFGLANVIRVQILDYFLENASKPGFNLAHFLLGFDMQKGVRDTIFDEKADNCLFLILDILDFGLGKPSSPVVALEHPSFTAKAYELVNALLSGKATSKPIMKLFQSEGRFKSFLSRHFSQTSKTLLTPTDVYLTAHELSGKAFLFRAFALELNISIHRKETTFLKLIAEQISSVNEYLRVINDISRPMTMSPEDQFEFARSITLYIQSLGKLIQVLLHQKLNPSIASDLCLAISPSVLYFLKSRDLTLDALESLGAVLISILAVEKSQDAEAVSTILEIIGSAESSLVLRGYMYSAFASLSKEHVARQSVLIKESLPRLCETIMKDLTSSGVDLEAWKTLTVAFLSQLSAVCPSVSSVMASCGYLKPLIKSLHSDELGVQLFFSNPNQSLNSLYLWTSKLSLFKRMTLTSLELLVEAGLLDQLTSIALIDRCPADTSLVSGADKETSSITESFSTHQQRQFFEATEAVLSLVVLCCELNEQLANANVHRGIVQFVGAHFDVLSKHLVIKSGHVKSLALLKLSAEIINYAGRDIAPIAAKHGVSMRHIFANILIKALLAIERDSRAENLKANLQLCSLALRFVSKVRLQGDSAPLVDFEELPADQLTQQGKLPISIIERLLVAFSRLAGQPGLKQSSLDVLEYLVFIIMFDFEQFLGALQSSQRPAGKTAPKELIRPLSKQLEAFSAQAAATNDDQVQSIKRWTRQVLFLVRDSDSKDPFHRAA